MRRAVWIGCLLLLPSLATSWAGPVWRSGRHDEVRPRTAAEVEARLTLLAHRESARHVVVRFDRPLDGGTRTELAAAGLTLLDPLGRGAWFATLDRDVDAARLAASGRIVDVDEIARVDKLHPDLAAGAPPAWSRLRPKPDAPLDPERTWIATYVWFHRDVGNDGAAAILARHGGGVRETLRSVPAVVAWLPLDDLDALASEDEVMYVEPPAPPLATLNAENRAAVGANTLQASPWDLDGSGVTVLVYDGGRAFAHPDFFRRLTTGPSDTSEADAPHATHVTGTIAGDGTQSGGLFRGMAPGADILSYGFQQGPTDILFEGFLYTDPGDLEADYAEAISLGADLANNSIGANVAWNYFPCEWEGDYGTIGAVQDAVTLGSLGVPFPNVWSNGNDRFPPGRCGTAYHTTGPTACNKNGISVGALNVNDDSVTSFTSWGPCDDGRVKPTLSAPGCEMGNDGGVTSTMPDGDYAAACGTSMAAPTVTGVLALLLQQYRIDHPAQPDPSPATLRAILVEAAADVAEVGPDYQSGYGALRGIEAVSLVHDGRFLEDSVGQGETLRFSIDVQPGDPELRVTLAWDDPPAVPNVVNALINDLDLRVIDPSGTVHFPWTLDPAAPDAPAVRTQRDAVNNLEQVTVDAPAAGSWVVEIEGFDLADGPTQSFSVAAAPSLARCASKGSLSTGRTRVVCEGTVVLRLSDCDLDLDAGQVDTASVSVVSSTEPAGETATLTETALDSGSFAGTLPLSQTDAVGTLRVSHGDTVTVTYLDADDGAGNANVPRTLELLADCTPAVVTSVQVPENVPGRATVQVDTDEPVTVEVLYGTSCAAPGSAAEGSTHGVSNAVALTTVPGTSYAFRVEALDDLGRLTVADNGGACYSFTSASTAFAAAEFLQAAPGALSHRRVIFSPDGQGDYTLCGETAAAIDLDGLYNSVLPHELNLDPSFEFYGVHYHRAYASAGGYITFDSVDADTTPTLEDHFRLPRVAGLFQGFSGAWYTNWDGDGPRSVWQGTDGQGNPRTFEIHIHADGRIETAWTEADDLVGIVGLSHGYGVDPSFTSAEMVLDGCPPRPPTAYALTTEGVQDTPQTIQLLGDDDGTPEPLRFVLEELPAIGELEEGSGGSGAILSVPRWLSPGVSTVTYTPPPGWIGSDSFSFRADDGGAQPDGGSSASKSVDVTVVPTFQTFWETLVDDADPGWTTQGGWAFGVPQGQSGDPTSGFTGSNVYGYNLAGAYSWLAATQYVTSSPIDVSGQANLQLAFEEWLRLADVDDPVSIQVSADGGAWTTVYTTTGPRLDTSWSLQTVDLSGFDGASQLALRFGLGPTNVLGHEGGWNLDDIRLEGRIVVDCDLGDPSVTLVPSVVKDVHVDAAGSIDWQDQAARSGSGTVYELISGDVAGGLADPAPVCLQNTNATTFIDTRIPAPGEGLYYLVRAWNSCGGGPWGTAGRDAAFPDSDLDGPSDVCDPGP